METLSRVLRWVGAFLVVVAGFQALSPVSDECGSVLQPHSSAPALLCTGPLADQQQLVVLLGVVGVAAGVAGQIVNWQQRKRA